MYSIHIQWSIQYVPKDFNILLKPILILRSGGENAEWDDAGEDREDGSGWYSHGRNQTIISIPEGDMNGHVIDMNGQGNVNGHSISNGGNVDGHNIGTGSNNANGPSIGTGSNNIDGHPSATESVKGNEILYPGTNCSMYEHQSDDISRLLDGCGLQDNLAECDLLPPTIPKLEQKIDTDLNPSKSVTSSLTGAVTKELIEISNNSVQLSDIHSYGISEKAIDNILDMDECDRNYNQEIILKSQINNCICNKRSFRNHVIDVGTQTLPAYIGESGKVESTCIYCKGQKSKNKQNKKKNHPKSMKKNSCGSDSFSEISESWSDNSNVDHKLTENGLSKSSCSWEWASTLGMPGDSGSPSTPSSFTSNNGSYESEFSCISNDLAGKSNSSDICSSAATNVCMPPIMKPVGQVFFDTSSLSYVQSLMQDLRLSSYEMEDVKKEPLKDSFKNCAADAEDEEKLSVQCGNTNIEITSNNISPDTFKFLQEEEAPDSTSKFHISTELLARLTSFNSELFHSLPHEDEDSFNDGKRLSRSSSRACNDKHISPVHRSACSDKVNSPVHRSDSSSWRNRCIALEVNTASATVTPI